MAENNNLVRVLLEMIREAIKTAEEYDGGNEDVANHIRYREVRTVTICCCVLIEGELSTKEYREVIREFKKYQSYQYQDEETKKELEELLGRILEYLISSHHDKKTNKAGR